VQAEAFDYPENFFAQRVWRIRRPRPDETELAEAARVLHDANAPLIIAGGGVHYSEAMATLDGFATTHGIPVAETQAGKRALRAAATAAMHNWRQAADTATAPSNATLPSDAQVIGAVQRAAPADAVVVCAAGGLPGELHKLWQARQVGTYHLEYGYSCMGYEIAGGLGVKLARQERELIVLVGE